MKIVIIGGVAAGASAAARARRLSEDAEIVILERGEFVSFANCGLPYHISEVIQERSDLLVMTPKKFNDRFRVDARVMQEVTGIDRSGKKVAVRDRRSGERYEETYDRLVIATGSSPVRPPIPGADDPDVMQLWTIPDMDRIKSRVDEHAKRAVVVGGGFIGLEVAENLQARGLKVKLVEMLPQVFPALDPEMTQPLNETLEEHGIELLLSRKLTAICRETGYEKAAPELTLQLDDGTSFTTDFVVMAVGVRPNSELAREAGLEAGVRGSVKVNEHLQTSDPHIYAAGDVTEVTHLALNTFTQVPLAGPANRQGRLVADHIFGRDVSYKGSLGTSVVKVFDLTAGSTGANEKTLRENERDYRKIYIHPASHASYYPGANPVSIKLLFDPNGRILGAQAVGRDGVDKRIDVLAAAMRMGGTVHDLEELELAYAPPYGSAKDPVNFAGMAAANMLRGDTDPLYPDGLGDDRFLLDVRFPEELDAEPAIDGAKLIPLPELRDRLDEIPQDKEIAVYCKVGLRGYVAERILKQRGYTAGNLSGGIATYRMFYPERND